MQLYALDSNEKKVFVASAHPGCDYFCIECKGRMRLRRSRMRKNHFFHLALARECRLAGKSIFHISVQQFIQKTIGSHACDLEVYFEEIKRIADIACYEQKIIIEVQCSPISAREVAERCRDYESIGWRVIWILHEKTFGRPFPTEAELFLEERTHYYTNINEETGHIYDRCVPIRFPIDIAVLQERPFSDRSVNGLPSKIQKRFTTWQFSASGDVLWHALQQEETHPLWLQLLKEQRPGRYVWIKRVWGAITSGVRSLWCLLLERATY
ncbi:MAG: hypothetical protein JSR46_03395 [Verrucomicrobia bacterium]|nr:hypothetical protein [Verrucomicrobiota bacterium]